MSNVKSSRQRKMVRFCILVSALTATIAPTAAVRAQDKSKYYSVTHSNEYKINWKAFYDKIDMMTAEVRKKLPHHLDIPYGKDPKQKLDLYLPPKKPSGAPVLVFLHGGAFFEGDRAHYGYAAGPLAKNGVLTVVPSYRLAPEFRFPDQPEDVQKVLAWVYRNIGSYGGDPEHIYIAGHSAGAILAAFVAMKTDWLARMSLPADLIKGCVPISANYDLRQRATNRKYAPTPDIQVEASPIFHIENPPRLTIVALGSLEEKNFLKPSQEFAQKIQGKGGTAEVMVVNDLDHDGIAISLGYEKSKLVQAILNMIKVR